MTDAKEKAEKSINPKLKPVRSDAYKLYYVNNTQLKSSFYDIRIIAGEIIPDNDENFIFREDVGFVFSPQHAKAVLKLLKERIDDYEDKFGQIPTLDNPIPPPIKTEV